MNVYKQWYIFRCMLVCHEQFLPLTVKKFIKKFIIHPGSWKKVWKRFPHVSLEYHHLTFLLLKLHMVYPKCEFKQKCLHHTEQPPSKVPELLNGISGQQQLSHVSTPVQPKPCIFIQLVTFPQGVIVVLQQEVLAAWSPAGGQRGTAISSKCLLTSVPL